MDQTIYETNNIKNEAFVSENASKWMTYLLEVYTYVCINTYVCIKDVYAYTSFSAFLTRNNFIDNVRQR